ncbi:restriction endonuclease [Streptomyces sp. NPDC050400]|uniref:restriction endonuclease n=1 Tax=Streptomyces sp. NPDC050400 TaxID=3365610 RepID=UPI00378DE67D
MAGASPGSPVGPTQEPAPHRGEIPSRADTLRECAKYGAACAAFAVSGFASWSFIDPKMHTAPGSLLALLGILLLALAFVSGRRAVSTYSVHSESRWVNAPVLAVQQARKAGQSTYRPPLFRPAFEPVTRRNKVRLQAHRPTVPQRSVAGPATPPMFDWRAAEHLAAQHMQRLGHHDARVTQGGADGGIDVRSATGVAQVKYQSRPAGRPVVQNLVGAAPRSNPVLYFYCSAGFTGPAREFADQIGIRLFRFDEFGRVLPVNSVAETALRNAGRG